MVGKTYLSPAHKFRILAHRGSTEGGACENTLAAFRFAVDAGVEMLETDVHSTKDQVPILFHDGDLKRLFGVNTRVNDLNLSELKELVLPDGSRIPTLEEALERFPSSKFNLDLKDHLAVKPAVSVIKKLKAQDRVLVSSFSRKRRLSALTELPGVATSADGFTAFMIFLSWRLGIKRVASKLLSGVQALQIPTKAVGFRFDQAPFITFCSNQSVEVHFWTVNSIEDAIRLKALGAAGIVTDKGKLMVEHFSKGY